MTSCRPVWNARAMALRAECSLKASTSRRSVSCSWSGARAASRSSAVRRAISRCWWIRDCSSCCARALSRRKRCSSNCSWNASSLSRSSRSHCASSCRCSSSSCRRCCGVTGGGRVFAAGAGEGVGMTGPGLGMGTGVALWMGMASADAGVGSGTDLEAAGLQAMTGGPSGITPGPGGMAAAADCGRCWTAALDKGMRRTRSTLSFRASSDGVWWPSCAL
mmetsp:Transcript_28278/g.50886  ORF Transcript_28278/g.50886 Transcript_28278/m.50886 type:complete len:220 (-) Transcript_28278:418-1077(-)